MSNDNPYKAPGSEVGDLDVQGYGEINIMSASGRLGRVRYIGYSVGITLVAMLAAMVFIGLGQVLPESVGPVVSAIAAGLAGLVVVVISIMLAIQRLHDMNWSGWLVILMLIPYLGSLFALLLWIWPGTQTANRYGAVPPPNTTGATVLALMVPLVFVIGIIAAISIPAYHDYQQRAAEMASESSPQ